MTPSELTSHSDLSETQKIITFTPAEAKMLVLAGPGTGKTHTLVHRVVNLVQNQGLTPFSELLVLSFSRTAVAEIRKRISDMVFSGAHDDLRFLNIRTFDSFSTKLLVSADENIDLSTTSYDDRIQLAVNNFSRNDPATTAILKQFRHIVIDEVQDLVGIRAQLVQQVLRVNNGGFTLFGDSAQGIFDYLVAQSGIGPTSIEFLSWVKKKYGENLIEQSLDQNYRVQHPSAAIASNTRDLIIGPQNNGKETYGKLQEIINSLESVGSVETPNYKKMDYGEKSVALLCRTNSDVLFATSKFIQDGIPCIVPPHKYEQGLPAWIARILGKYVHDRISWPIFEEKWQGEIGYDHSPTANTAWKILKSVEDSEREYLDLSILRTRLRKGIAWVFDSESYSHNKNILVTTIHQSKGREYDHVLILSSGQQKNEISENNAVEEAKILYVAATRARENLSKLERGGVPISLRMQFPSGKERQSGQSRAGKHLIEVLPEDIDPMSYVHKWLFPNSNLVQTVQGLLWKHILPGTKLNLIPQSINEELKFVLTWINPSSGKPIPIAWLSDQFREDLKYFLLSLPNNANIQYRPLMEGVFVFERVSIVLPPFAERIYDPWATSGCCLGLGIKGVVVID